MEESCGGFSSPIFKACSPSNHKQNPVKSNAAAGRATTSPLQRSAPGFFDGKCLIRYGRRQSHPTF